MKKVKSQSLLVNACVRKIKLALSELQETYQLTEDEQIQILTALSDKIKRKPAIVLK